MFKENTNLELDAKKVRSEREELISMLDTFMKNIDSGQMDNFIEQIDQELSDENKLSELLKQEKDLADQIKVLRWSTKALKQSISDETKEFEGEMKDKKNDIQTLKDEAAKERTASAVKLRYEKKVEETKVATKIRMNNQGVKNIQKEKEEVIDLQRREGEVFTKIQSYLKEEDNSVNIQTKEWEVNRRKIRKNWTRRRPM